MNKRSNLFQEEKAFFQKHIPNNIENNCSLQFSELLPDNFILHLLGEQPINNVENFELEVTPFDPNDIFPEETLEQEYFHRVVANIDFEDGDSHFHLNQLVANFGREAFGMYLPYHYYEKCWGIYLFEELINQRVKFLHSLFHTDISFEKLLQLYYYAVYRHELFHYQVERFATKIELITKKPIYNPSRYLFHQVSNSEDWLEEALAESTVLNSILVSQRTGLSKQLIREIYERDLKDMPPGYRDYHCAKFGGPKEAHKLFASQIVENKLSPEAKLTPLVSVTSEFISIDRKVPCYEVTGFGKLRRIRL